MRAWHDGDQTYALCGIIPESRMMIIATGLRLAGSFRLDDQTSMLASIGP
ncbi:MAG: hypothetical protein IIB57_14885 [Planctomycetes bacterium]|nr:hypothetical protein [Planctomycetota bacterium]